MHRERDCRKRMMPLKHVSLCLPLYGANSNSPILSALHAKRSIVNNDTPVLRTAPNLGLGNAFIMQTPSQATANPLQPVSALDGNRQQLPRVNTDKQCAKPQQLTLSAAFDLSANTNASKAQFLGSMEASPGAWESNSTSEDFMALDSISANLDQSSSSAALKISTKRSMPNLSRPQPRQSRWESDSTLEGSTAMDNVPTLSAPQPRQSAASKLRRSVSFAVNLDAPNRGKSKVTT